MPKVTQQDQLGPEPLNSHPSLELYELECGHEPSSAGPLVLPGTGLGIPVGSNIPQGQLWLGLPHCSLQGV